MTVYPKCGGGSLRADRRRPSFVSGLCVCVCGYLGALKQRSVKAIHMTWKACSSYRKLRNSTPSTEPASNAGEDLSGWSY
jgi:hypothetical protein